MIAITCDHCREPVDCEEEVVYILAAMDPLRVDVSGGLINRSHLHWKCVPLYGRTQESTEELPF